MTGMPKEIGVCKFNNGSYDVFPDCADIPPATKYIRADLVPPHLKCFYTDKPKGNIIAIYSDLSGAEYFHLTDSGKWTSDDNYTVDLDWFTDAGYLWFIEDKDND